MLIPPVSTVTSPVRDLAGQQDLLLEARQDVRVSGEFGTNDFQRNQTLERQVFGFVHRAHAAFADGLLDFVTSAQDRAVGQNGRGEACGRDFWTGRRRGSWRSS